MRDRHLFVRTFVRAWYGVWYQSVDNQVVSSNRTLRLAHTHQGGLNTLHSSADLSVLTNLVTAWLVLQVSVDAFVTGKLNIVRRTRISSDAGSSQAPLGFFSHDPGLVSARQIPS